MIVPSRILPLHSSRFLPRTYSAVLVPLRWWSSSCIPWPRIFREESFLCREDRRRASPFLVWSTSRIFKDVWWEVAQFVWSSIWLFIDLQHRPNWPRLGSTPALAWPTLSISSLFILFRECGCVAKRRKESRGRFASRIYRETVALFMLDRHVPFRNARR